MIKFVDNYIKEIIYFQQILRKCREAIIASETNIDLGLSMGMSDDFEHAIGKNERKLTKKITRLHKQKWAVQTCASARSSLASATIRKAPRATSRLRNYQSHPDLAEKILSPE